MGANSSDAAIQLHIHLASLPSSLTVLWVQWQFLKNLISQVMTSLSGPLSVLIQAAQRDNDTLTIGYSSKNLSSSPFIHARMHTEREKFGETQKGPQSLTPLSLYLPPTQTHSSTISSQRDCTHSNKQRRRLLSECNYLVLSISLTAVEQRALC